MSGKEALDFMTVHLPDLILLDIMMPELNGFEVCKTLKADKKFQDIPIIFLTAKTETDDIVKGFNLGASDYITKPFNSAELLSRVATHIENKRNREIILEQNREQKELLHILCHDLYNPFAAIHSSLEIIREDPNSLDTIINLIDKSSSNGMQMIDLVRQMRALMEKESLLELTSLNLSASFLEAVSLLKNRLTAKQIKLDIQIPNHIHIIGEDVSLKNSVINNILTNAIKFSYAGSDISVTTEETEKEVRLIITDHGIGIPETILQQIFDIKKATSRVGTEQEMGTGFGMPLVEKFMTVYGGAIQISSKEEKEFPNESGTIVTLIFKKPG